MEWQLDRGFNWYCRRLYEVCVEISNFASQEELTTAVYTQKANIYAENV